MSGPDHPPIARSHGPWMLKAVGTWGTGRRSAFDVEVFIVDLGIIPTEDDPSLPEGPVTSTFITEDVEPGPGLDVEIGDQILKHLNQRMWAVRDD